MSQYPLIVSAIAACLLIGCASETITKSQSAADLDWPRVTQVTKPWARWWWLGSAVDKKNLTREMEQMKAVGIGGVEVTPLYGAMGYEDRYIDFLSPKWIEMLRHVGEEGKRLKFGVDMATGTGWPLGGGPVVTPDIADMKVDRQNGKLVGVPTQMKVKRAAPGDEGWVLDPYSIDALKEYLDWFKPLDSIPRGLVSGQFHDSFEYMGNWTSGLPARFKQMHGYDINDHVAELFGEGNPDTVSRVKSDYRETLNALHYDFVAYWVKWCNEHGYEAREQAHGAPANLLDLYGVADVPETETFGSSPFTIPGFRRDPTEIASNGNGPNHIVTRFATSAEHVMGREYSSCETLTWLREHWKVALSMAKPEVDQMFLAGINHILYHGTCYSPEDAPWPGWLFYASTEVNPRDTLWKTLPQLNQYITRCQSVLQTGSPDNDVLVYFPFYDHIDKAEGMEIFFKVSIKPPWLVGTEIEKICQQLTDGGYAFDMVSDAQLEMTQNSGTALKVPGGRYRVLLVPRTNKMPLKTLQRIMKLAEGGAKVVFIDQLPQDVPGLGDLENQRAQFKQTLSQANWKDDRNNIATANVGNGHLFIGSELKGALTAANVKRETFTGENVNFIRRRFDGGHHYFIASQGTREINGWVPLSVDFESAVILDPLTGQTGVAATRKADGTEIYLQLRPGESMIVRTFKSTVTGGRKWEYPQSAGQPVELTGKWQVEFIDGGPERPQSFETEKLGSWTDRDDIQAKRFAGTARYRLYFDAPANMTGPFLLDLGDVREAAEVRLNSSVLGTAWALPFVIPIDHLNPRGNILEIDVTNLTSNRIRDLDRRGVKWRIFREINYVNIDYQPFDASNWPVAPLGLLGPVKIVPMKILKP